MVLNERSDDSLWERDHTRTMDCLRFLPAWALTRILLQSRQYRQSRFLEIYLDPALGDVDIQQGTLAIESITAGFGAAPGPDVMLPL